MFKRIISLALSVVFSLQTCGFAQVAQLNLAGYLGQAGSVTTLDRFRPASLRYFSYEPKTDGFRILLDKADEKGLNDIQVKDKADELMKYFRIGLSLPNEKFWVNLRPDAPEQIIDDELATTDIGKIMLEADLQLKKDTARFTSPQTPEGRQYWDKLYKKAGELFGSENITIPTITRPWIVPGEIIVRESGSSGSTSLTTSAYIYKAALKVMLEEDYLTSRGGSRTAPTYQQYAFSDPRLKELNQYSTQLIRETIIPKLTKEINRSKRYAALRQVFYSLVLSRWFKERYKGETRNQSTETRENSYIKLIDSGNLTNLSSQEAWDKTTYFKAYQKSFKEGEYSLSESVYTPTGQVIRRYVSGGTLFGNQIRIAQYSNMVDSLIAPKGAYTAVITGNGLIDQTAISAGSAIEEQEILNAKKTELKGMISGLFRESEVIYNLQKAIWMLRLDKSDSPSTVKKICDDIIKWIDEDKDEPKRDKKPFEAFSDSLKVIPIIGELKSLALLLEVSPSIINKALEKIETVQDESQRREILKELVNQLEAIMPADVEQLKKISASLNKSGSPLSEKMKNLLITLNQNIKEFSDNFDSLPKSNQDLPILAAQLGKIRMMIEEMENELWYFLSPEVFLADESIKSGIDFELIHDAFNRKLQEALEKENQTIGGSHQFILETKISIAGATYNSFDVSKVISPSLDGYKISFRYSEGNRDDITLYIDRDIEETSITVGNEAIKEELIRQIGKGSNLQYIVEPIKKALVSSAVTAAEADTAASPLESLKNKALGRLSKYLDDATYQQVLPYISNARSIDKLREIFDSTVESLKNKVKYVGVKAFDPGELNEFSDTLFVLVILEKMDKILKERNRHIKMMAETYTSLSKEQQLSDLDGALNDLKKAGAEIKSLSLQLEEARAKIAGSPLTKANVIKIINDFIQALKSQVIPNEYFLKRIELSKNNQEIYWLLQRLIPNNDRLMDALEELQKQISKPLEVDYSPAQFDKELKDMLENVVLGKVLVIGSKSDPDLTATVKEIKESYTKLSEKQPDTSKTSFNLEWIDSTKGRTEQIRNTDVIITSWQDIANNMLKHFEFSVILSDGNRIILKKIPSSVPGQEARGEDSSLTAVEMVKLAKEAIWGKDTGPSQIAFTLHPGESPIDAVKNMFKSILSNKNYTYEPVSYLSDFTKIVERCSEKDYGQDFASLFYAIKQTLRTSQIFDTKNDLDLRRLQGTINGAFEGYLKFIQINIPEFMSNPKLIISRDLSEVIEFVSKKDEIVIKLPNKTKIGKHEVLAGLEFIKEVTASSAITKQIGGIDFRSMNMLIQPMGSFSGLDFSPARLSSSALESMDLDKELEGIKQLASGSMLPSPQRLKEYISACIFKGKVGEKADEFVLSMLEVFQLQAEEGIESAAAEREAVVMADTKRYVLPEERLAVSNSHSLN